MPHKALSLALFLLACLPCLRAQNTPALSADFRQADLKTALRQLEDAHPVSFSYDDEVVKNIRVSARFTRLPLPEAMRTLLAGTGLDFEIVDNQYVLLKKAAPPELPAKVPELTLCGKIFDQQTNEPLPGATAWVKKSSRGTTAGEDGSFTLTGDFKPSDTLEISFLGYRRQAVLVKNLLGRPCASFALDLDLQVMSDVVILDFAVDMVSLGEDGGFSFKKEKTPTLPGWGEPDVLRLLQLLPGVASADESASNLNVRGGTPDQNLVMWDGIPIYHTGHFFGLYDAFNPSIVKSVDVWRGNFGAEFGGRNSSVVAIEGKPDFLEKTRWGAGMNLLSTQAFVEIPLKKNRMTLLVALRRSYSHLIKSATYQNLFNQLFQNGRVALQEQALQESEFYTWQPDFRYGDANLKLAWRGKRQRESSVSLYSNDDRLDYRFAYDDGGYFYSTYDHISASNFGMSWQHRAQWSPEFRVRYKAALSAYRNDYSFQWSDDRSMPYLQRWATENSMTDFSAQFHHAWQVSERHEMSFGYQLAAQEASLAYRAADALAQFDTLLAADTTRSALHTFYGEFSYRPSPRFEFTLGIRENHFPARGLYYSEPRVHFTWRPFGGRRTVDGRREGVDNRLPSTVHRPPFAVKGGFGRHWQFVFQIVELNDLGVGEPLWALADESIPAQEVWQWSLGASLERKTWLVDAEFYLKKNSHLTSLNLRVDRGFNRPWTFDGKSTARGFDFLLRKRWKPYSLWLAYSLGEVEQSFPGLNGDLPYPARHDFRHRLNFVNAVAFKHWDFSLNLHARSGSPYSEPVVVQVPCESCTADSLTYALDFPRLNAKRLPGALRLDIGATWKFETPGGLKGKIGLAAYNLLNRRNLLDKDFLFETPPADEPQTGYTLQGLNRLAAGATPNFYAQFEW